MSYTYLPVAVPGPSSTNNTDIDFAPCINELWFALRERYWGKGDCNWPPPNRVYTSGVVTGATETVITDSAAMFCTAGGGMYRLPIPCIVDTPDSDYNDPTSLYLVVDDPDPAKVVKVAAGSNTATAITVANMRDYVTSKRIPSIASLIGKPYYLIRGDRGLWSSDRMLEWINDYQWAVGTVGSLGADTDDYGHAIPASPTHTFFRDPTKHWKKNEHSDAAREVLLYADDGFLKRVVITSNTADTITFATQTWTPITPSPYVIVTAGAKALPGRDPTYHYAWYRGHREGYLSHDVDNTMTSALMPSSTVKVPGAQFGMCFDFDRPTWDNDFRTDQQIFGDDQMCGTPPDKFYAPDFYKTLRGWDVGAEMISEYYVEAMSYTGAPFIPYLNPAETFRLAGINAFVAATGNVEGAVGNDGSSNNAIAISGATMPFLPIQVHYSITRPNGDYLYGQGIMTANNRLLHQNSDLVFTQTNDLVTPSIPGVNGRTITIALGFSRFVPREFKRMLKQPGVFIPDVVTDPMTMISTAIDPATVADFSMTECLGVGLWVPRGASTKSIERKHESQTYTDAQGFSWEIGDDYVTGQLYRYVGDNYFDPTVHDGGGFFLDTEALVGDYYRRFYVGEIGTLQGRRNRQLFGNVTETGTIKTSLRDVKKNWFDYQWFGGTMRTETGTATSGTTTNLTDNTKADADPTSPTNPLNCMWAVSRFSGTNPYLGFSVEIDEIRTDPSGQPYTVTHRRLITASNPTSVGVTWAEPLPVSAAGLVYRIKEPYYLNRYVDRMVKVTHFSSATGAVIAEETVKITGNSEDTLFFDTLTFTPESGDQYEIIEPLVGTVWKWNGTKMVKPTGNDVTRYGVPVQHPFHDNQRENLPHYLLRYGRYMIGDAISSETLNERYAFINVLRWTMTPSVNWTAYASAAAVMAMTPTANVMPDAFEIGAWCTMGDAADRDTARAMITADWAASTPVATEGVAPYSSIGQTLEPTACDIAAGAAMSYARVDNVPTCHNLAHSTVFYNFGWADSLNSDQGDIGCGCLPDPADRCHNGSVDPQAAAIAMCTVFPDGGDPGPCDHGLHIQFVATAASVSFRTYTAWSTTTPGVTSTDYSAILGSLAHPEFCTVKNWWHCESPLAGRSDGCRGGYYVGDARAIHMWNVAGGFKYVAP